MDGNFVCSFTLFFWHSLFLLSSRLADPAGDGEMFAFSDVPVPFDGAYEGLQHQLISPSVVEVSFFFSL